MFTRSLVAVDKWIAELAPKKVAAPAAAAAAAAASSSTAAADKKEKKGGAAAATATAAAAGSGTAVSKISFLVGKILEVANHPESDHLYVEKIDLGEPEGPRTIISGLREHVTIEQFTGRNVIVVANLEPRKMRGILSAGMVLCASLPPKEGSDKKDKVCLLDVPAGAKPGERVTFPGHDGPAEPVLKKKLAKLYEEVAPTLKTDAAGVVVCSGLPFVTSAGPVTCAAIPNGNVT